MGIPWSAILYSDNTVRRDQVQLLVQRIRNTVVDFYAQVRLLSSTLHRKASPQYQELGPFDINLTFGQNLDKVTQVLEQWKSVVKKLEQDPNISQEVRDALEKLKSTLAQSSSQGLPDLANAVTSDPLASMATNGAALVAGSIAGMWSSIFFELRFSDLLKALSLSDAIGLGAGVAVGELVTFVVAAIQGYTERNELEKLKAEYSSLATKLENATEDNRLEVENIIYAVTILAASTN